jgi:diguanylate cyclase (GGDEF)-like protein
VTAIRDSGQATDLPYQIGDRTWLTIETPIYRSGGLPTTVEARRAAFVGLFVVELDPSALLTEAVRGRPGLSVAMRYHEGERDISFVSGPAARGATSVTTDVHNGWTVQTFGVLPRGGLSDRTGLTALIAGIAITVLIGLLVFILGTGRERARRLVKLRTEQLHYQALHDALTGLPNRALVLDRIEQMLVRNRRRHTTGAVMFLDLDDFKNVNDTLGHSAGDRLLVEVAARLTSVVRDADTIGRMGGDEFVVLVDGTSPELTPELVAERLLDVMRQPFELDADAPPLEINVSIGIAAGDRDSATDMLRDADLALYQAKARGKNRYEIFEARTPTSIGRRNDIERDLRTAFTDN